MYLLILEGNSKTSSAPNFGYDRIFPDITTVLKWCYYLPLLYFLIFCSSVTCRGFNFTFTRNFIFTCVRHLCFLGLLPRYRDWIPIMFSSFSSPDRFKFHIKGSGLTINLAHHDWSFNYSTNN